MLDIGGKAVSEISMDQEENVLIWEQHSNTASCSVLILDKTKQLKTCHIWYILKCL